MFSKRIPRRLFNAWYLIREGSFWELIKKTTKFFANATKITSEITYEDWRNRWVELSPGDRSAITNKRIRTKFKTSFSLVLELNNEAFPMLKETVTSVVRQDYPNWNLYIISKSSNKEKILEFAQEIKDERIKIVEDYENITDGFIGVLKPGDLLHEFALKTIILALQENPQAGVIYTDNDHITLDGKFIDPHFKPDWNPDLLLGMNYMSSFCLYAKPLWEAHDNPLENLHEFTIKTTFSLAASQIIHLPYVLASIRVKDLTSHLSPDVIEVKHPSPDPLPKVSVLIPTKDKGMILERCLTSLHEITDYPNFELIIIDHESTQEKARNVISDFSKKPHVSITTFSGEFNFASMMNKAANLASGEIFLLLNNDTEIIQKEWMTELVSQVTRNGVAIAGPLLLFNDYTIQHAGVHPGVGGLMGHGHKHLKFGKPGYFSRLKVAHDVAAVTGACLAIKTSDWKLLGGLDEKNFPVAYNDIDLCLKARKEGLRIIFTPNAQLIHHESITRGFDNTYRKRKRLEKETTTMKNLWGSIISLDPAYNPNLSFENGGFKLAETPRVEHISNFLTSQNDKKTQL